MATMAPSAETAGARLDGAAKLDDPRVTEGVGVNPKIDDCKHIDDVKCTPEVVRSRLYDVKAAGNGKWESIKAGVESVRTDLDIAFRDVISRFRDVISRTASTYNRWMNPPGK